MSDIITLNEFKTHFRRDFPFLPIFDDSVTYNADDIVYYTTTNLFYKCKSNGTTELPTDNTKWDLYSDDKDNYVLDEDITKAFSEANVNITSSVSGDRLKLAYKYLSAHYLVMDIKASTQGLVSGPLYAVVSKSVGSISESYSIPDKILKNPALAYLVQTHYGYKYIMMVYHISVGVIYGKEGITLP